MKMMDNYTLGILWGCGQYSENSNCRKFKVTRLFA